MTTMVKSVSTSKREDDGGSTHKQGRRSSLSMIVQPTSTRSFEQRVKKRQSSLSMLQTTSNRSMDRGPGCSTLSMRRLSVNSSLPNQETSFTDLTIATTNDMASNEISVTSFGFYDIDVVSTNDEDDFVFEDDPFGTNSHEDCESSLGDFAFDSHKNGEASDSSTNANPSNNLFCHHVSLSAFQAQTTIAKQNKSLSAIHTKFYSSKLSSSGAPSFHNSGNLYSSRMWLEDEDEEEVNAKVRNETTIQGVCNFFKRGTDVSDCKVEKKSEMTEKKKEKKKIKTKIIPKKDVTGSEFSRMTKQQQSQGKDISKAMKTGSGATSEDDETGTVATQPMTPTSSHSSVDSGSIHSQQTRHSNQGSKSKSHWKSNNDVDSCCSSQASLNAAVEEIKPDNRLSKIVLLHMKKMQQQKAG